MATNINKMSRDGGSEATSGRPLTPFGSSSINCLPGGNRTVTMNVGQNHMKSDDNQILGGEEVEVVD